MSEFITTAMVRAFCVINGIDVPAKGNLGDKAWNAYMAAAATAKGAEVKAEAPAKGAEVKADEPVTIDARSFVKVNGDWFIRVLPGDKEGDTVEVARRNRAATTATLGAIETRKIGAQTYAVAPMVKAPAKAAEVKAEAPAKAAEVKATAAPIGHAIATLTVNGNVMYTVTVGTTVRLFAKLEEAAAYAATA